MVPLRIRSPGWVRLADDSPHRSTAFRHATLHHRPGLWGDDAERPKSAIWLREGDGETWEAFGAGRPTPAVGWLASRVDGRPIALLAPASWEAPIRLLGGRVEAGTIETRLRPDSWLRPTPPTRVEVRRLGPDDGPAFEAAAPSWALRSWGAFAALIEHGAAFGVPTPGGFASLAWTSESDLDHDKVGVATEARYRNLGLGRASALSLVEHVVRDRRTRPLWVTTPENGASIALGVALGFSIRVEERLLRWTPATASPSDAGSIARTDRQ